MINSCNAKVLKRLKCNHLIRHHNEFASSASGNGNLKGINFFLTDRQEEMAKEIRQFIAQEVIPKNKHYDITGEFPWPEVKKFHKLGYMNPMVPKACGGPGMTCLDTTVIAEELAYGCAGFSTVCLTNSLCVPPILKGGTEEQRKKWLGRLIEEPMIASFCITEPDAGSDMSRMITFAEKKGDEWLINGHKIYITGSGHANWYFLVARTTQDPKVPISKALSGFVVERATPGIELSEKMQMMGQRCSDNRYITFKNVIIPKENLIGPIGAGCKLALMAFQGSRSHLAACAVGLSRRALDEATAYSIKRKTYGKSIINHQAVSCLLADIAISTELGRLIARRAAFEYDLGSPVAYWACIAKAFCGDMVAKNTHNAVQIYGGAGYWKDNIVEKLQRDARIFSIYEGTHQMQQLLIARYIHEQFQKPKM